MKESKLWIFLTLDFAEPSICYIFLGIRNLRARRAERKITYRMRAFCV
jgi:hypothetical protein